MKNPSLSFALRQLRQEFSRPVTWIVLIGIGIVLAIAGAFGTGDILRPVPLAAYWIAVVILTYAAGGIVSGVLRPPLADASQVLRIIVLGLATGLAVAAVILGMNTALFGLYLEGPREIAQFVGTIFAVTLVISTVLELALGAGPKEAALEPPRILDRIAPEKRGPLVALSVEDHYVRVRTTKAEDMVLMRLADAMGETGEGGLQVHRSHWVALDQIVAARREGDRAVLTMKVGPEIPVSRRYVPEIKAAGFL